jgi:hypothetical protein
VNRSKSAQDVYDLYRRHGEERGAAIPTALHSDLDTHYRCGKLGVRRPGRDRPAALAAWEAGRDNAKVTRGPA